MEMDFFTGRPLRSFNSIPVHLMCFQEEDLCHEYMPFPQLSHKTGQTWGYSVVGLIIDFQSILSRWMDGWMVK